MIKILTDSKKNTKKEPTVVYLRVEKETIMIDQVFNMLFQMLDEEVNSTD